MITYGLWRSFEILEQQNDYPRYRRTLSFYGYKVILTNYYSLLVAHIKHRRLKGLWTNLKVSTREVRYYISKRYQPMAGVGDFPCLIKMPPKKTTRQNKGNPEDEQA